MSFNFGSSERRDRGSQTTTIQMPAASPEETELKKLNLELAKRQIAAMDRAETEQAAAGGEPVSQLQKDVQKKALENIYARLTGQSPVLNPEEQARLDTIYNTAKTQGEEALTQYADQLAGVRGMRVSDTPIGGEVLRQRGNLELGLQGQKAASSLDLSQAGADFNARMAEFTGNLRQQAFMNQLALAGTTPASFGLQNQLFGERLATAPRTNDFRGLTGMTGWNTGFDLSKAAGGAAMMAAS